MLTTAHDSPDKGGDFMLTSALARRITSIERSSGLCHVPVRPKGELCLDGLVSLSVPFCSC
jgi:hypothetical protein